MSKLLFFLKAISLICSILLIGIGIWSYRLSQELRLLKKEIELLKNEKKKDEVLGQNFITTIFQRTMQRQEQLSMEVSEEQIEASVDIGTVPVRSKGVTIIYGDETFNSESEGMGFIDNISASIRNSEVYGGHQVRYSKSVDLKDISLEPQRGNDTGKYMKEIVSKVDINTPYILYLAKNQFDNKYAVGFIDTMNYNGVIINIESPNGLIVDPDLVLSLITTHYESFPLDKSNTRYLLRVMN